MISFDQNSCDEPKRKIWLTKPHRAIHLDFPGIGPCGFVFNSDERSKELAQWEPIVTKNKKNAGSLSLWESESGRRLVLAQALVTWEEPN